ncbi:MAG: Gfo/Idh/MocA family oxidoreductase [Phycisphaeraceae bacterium]|nr:Gfo/Idh/MocA family oxidoreductase [Phycisphaeraceae bacterium]
MGTIKMPELRWAIIGTGDIARKVAPLLASAEGNRITAVCSRDAARAKTFAQQFGIEHAGTYADLFERADLRQVIDAVYLTLPNRMHPQWCTRLLEAGFHVLCEKPLCWTRAQAEQLFAAAERHQRILLEGFMYLHHPQTAELARIARDPAGPIGPLQHVEAWFETDMKAAGREATRYSHALAGGTMMDIGCYPVSFIRSVTRCSLTDSSASQWHAQGAIAPPLAGETSGIDERVRVEGRLNSDVSFAFEARMDRPGRKEVRLTGAWGSVWTDWPWSPDPKWAQLHVERSAQHPHGPGQSTIVIEHGGDKFINQFTAFASAVRGEQSAHPSASWSIEQAGDLEAILGKLGIDFEQAS